MSNKKEIILGVAALAVVAFLFGARFWSGDRDNGAPQNGNGEPVLKEGLVIESVKEGDTVSSPLKITGYTNKGGWGGFEAQFGTVRLVDSTGKQVALGVLTATEEDWMKFPAKFEAVLEFNTPQAETGELIFKNENASGLPELDKEFRMQVKLGKPAQEVVKVKAYFNNSLLDPEVSCNKVFPVEREVVKTQALAKAALGELLKGPRWQEKEGGFETSINPDVVIQKLTIESGVAKVDFNEQLQFQVGGSCRVSAIRAQITETLKQFPTVTIVVVSINSRTEDILQP